MLLPALVSVGGWFGQFDLCSGGSRGANVNHGLMLVASTAVVLVCVLGLMLLLSRDIWRWRYWIAGACVVEAAVVGAAVAFIAIDSATVISTECDFLGPSPNEVHRLAWLYYAFGFAVAALLFQAVSAARCLPPRPSEPESESDADVVGLPLD